MAYSAVLKEHAKINIFQDLTTKEYVLFPGIKKKSSKFNCWIRMFIVLLGCCCGCNGCNGWKTFPSARTLITVSTC